MREDTGQGPCWRSDTAAAVESRCKVRVEVSLRIKLNARREVCEG